jgi:hypothetical protein
MFLNLFSRGDNFGVVGFDNGKILFLDLAGCTVG